MLKAVILDIDGVIVRGWKMIPGTGKAVEKLRKMGLKIFFLSNNASRSRKSLCEKINKIGIRTEESEVYPASYATASYIAEKYPNAKVYAMSSGGIEEELAAKGVRVVNDSSAGIVAVGFDRTMTYDKIAIGFRAIMKGALFIASNEDPSFPVEDGLMPGAGAMVGALRFSTGKNPDVVIGKPHTYMIEMILKDAGLKKGEVLLVGDRFDTDIRMAKRAGIKSVLVLSGISGEKDVKKNGKTRPDLILKDLSGLPGKIPSLNKG